MKKEIILNVYQKRQAGVVNGVLDRKTSTLLKSKITTTADNANAMNKGYPHSGVYYALNKEATKKFKEAKAKKAKK